MPEQRLAGPATGPRPGALAQRLDGTFALAYGGDDSSLGHGVAVADLRVVREAGQVVTSSGFASDGLLATAAGKRVWLTDLATAARTEFRPPHDNDVFVRYLPLGKKWVTWSYDDTVRLWAAPDHVERFWAVPGATRHAGVSADERHMVVRTKADPRHGLAVVGLTAPGTVRTAATVALVNEPHEMHNLYGERGQEALTATLKSELAKLKREFRDDDQLANVQLPNGVDGPVEKLRGR